MTTYAIGDVQGCFRSLQYLLESCRFDPAADRLWFVGDLVNRGPRSLETLRFVRKLGGGARLVLGNHDLYLLMLAYGALAKPGKDDTLGNILTATDAPEIFDWLRQQPLCLREGSYCMVHAGLLPEWNVDKAVALSAEVEAALQGDRVASFLAELWGSHPDGWSDTLAGAERLRVIVNVMTRMRFCTADGRLNFSAKGKVEKAPDGLVPWFLLPGRQSAEHTLIVGHWSALGLYQTANLLAIDTGCLWGGKLTAVRLEDRSFVQVDCLPEERLVANFS